MSLLAGFMLFPALIPFAETLDQCYSALFNVAILVSVRVPWKGIASDRDLQRSQFHHASRVLRLLQLPAIRPLSFHRCQDQVFHA